MKRTPLRPGSTPLARHKPLTAKQRGFLRHKAKERTRQLWTEKLGKPKLQPIKALTDRAWSAFSKYVRLEARTWGLGIWCGESRCYTCGVGREWKEMHAGHFVHAGRRNPVSYDERNVHSQCPKCNYYGMSGHAAIVYATKMIAEHGPGITDALLAMKAQSKPLSRTELHEIALKYEAKVQEMLG